MPPRATSVWLKGFESDSSPSEDLDDELTSACIQKLTLKEAKPFRPSARIGRQSIPHPSAIATAFKVGSVKHPEWMVVQCTPPLLASIDEEGSVTHGCRVIPEFFKPHTKVQYADARPYKDERMLKFSKRPPLYPSKTRATRPTPSSTEMPRA